MCFQSRLTRPAKFILRDRDALSKNGCKPVPVPFPTVGKDPADVVASPYIDVRITR